DQVVAAVELYVDLGKGVLVGVAGLHQTVVEADDEQRQQHAAAEDDEKEQEESGHGNISSVEGGHGRYSWLLLPTEAGNAWRCKLFCHGFPPSQNPAVKRFTERLPRIAFVTGLAVLASCAAQAAAIAAAAPATTPPSATYPAPAP